MKCPNCGFENPEVAKFCGKCGTVIRTTQTGSNPSGAWYLVPIFFGILGGNVNVLAEISVYKAERVDCALKEDRRLSF